MLEPIREQEVIDLFAFFEHKPVHLHAETTSGAYANHLDQRVFNAGTFLENIQTIYTHAQLRGGNREPYRTGFELSSGGWAYVQGLTHFEANEHDEFLTAGFNYEGQFAAALQISERPFNL